MLVVAQVALGLGGLGLLVATFMIVRRLHRARRDITREIGEQIASEGLFRDDGERIIVYANRGRVLLRALTSVAVLALFVAGSLWARAVEADAFSQIVLAVGIGLLLCFGGVLTLLTLIRAVMTNPTLVVNADGILDNCSMIVTGRGLLRWNETLGVQAHVYSANLGVSHHYLDINVADLRAINRRQPRWKRALAIFASQRQPMGLRIPRALLDHPPPVLVKEINRYINAHAPEGSWHKAVTEDEADRPDEE